MIIFLSLTIYNIMKFQDLDFLFSARTRVMLFYCVTNRILVNAC